MEPTGESQPRANTSQLADLHKTFLRERQYLDNLSPKTISFLRQSFNSLRRFVPEVEVVDGAIQPPPSEFVVCLRESGVKPVTCNTYIRGINCFLTWLRERGMNGAAALKQLRVERLVPPTVDSGALTRLMGYKPKSDSQRRVHAAVLTVLDTGMRISEVTGLRVCDVDMDGMVMRVMGKGRRERMMPFSTELRRVLFRYCPALGTSSTTL